MRHLVLPNIEPNERNHRLYILALETFNLQTFEFKFFLVLGKLGFLLYYLFLPSPIKILGLMLITRNNLGTGFNLKRNIFFFQLYIFPSEGRKLVPPVKGQVSITTGNTDITEKFWGKKSSKVQNIFQNSLPSFITLSTLLLKCMCPFSFRFTQKESIIHCHLSPLPISQLV